MTDELNIRPLGPHAEGVLRRHREAMPGARIVGADDPAELVAVTPEDLAEMLEDAIAAAAYARSRHDESVPIEIADKLINGDNPIRVWRQYRGLSLELLALTAGIGKGYLSQLERGERTGTVQSMQKLAAALKVDIEDLI